MRDEVIKVRIRDLKEKQNKLSEESRELELLLNQNTCRVAEQIIVLETKNRTPQEERKLALLYDPHTQLEADRIVGLEFKDELSSVDQEYLSRCYLSKICKLSVVSPWAEHWHRFATKLWIKNSLIEDGQCRSSIDQEIPSSIYNSRRLVKLKVIRHFIENAACQLLDSYFNNAFSKRASLFRIKNSESFHELYQRRKSLIFFMLSYYFSEKKSAPFTFENLNALVEYLKVQIYEGELILKVSDVEDLIGLLNFMFRWQRESDEMKQRISYQTYS